MRSKLVSSNRAGAQMGPSLSERIAADHNFQPKVNCRELGAITIHATRQARCIRGYASSSEKGGYTDDGEDLEAEDLNAEVPDEKITLDHATDFTEEVLKGTEISHNANYLCFLQ